MGISDIEKEIEDTKSNIWALFSQVLQYRQEIEHHKTQISILEEGEKEIEHHKTQISTLEEREKESMRRCFLEQRALQIIERACPRYRR